MTNDEAGKWIGWGQGDLGVQVEKIEHRLLNAYPNASKARDLGVEKDKFYTEQTVQAVKNFQEYVNRNENLGLRTDGIADYKTQLRLGAVVKPVGPIVRYPMQGVWADSRAFLNPPEAHCFNDATNDFAAEGIRLYSGMVGTPIVVLGYSMGGISSKKFLDRLPVEWRQFVKMLVTFGDPAMPAEGSLLGDGPGEGISKTPQPEWIRDRYYSFAIDGDWYPNARGLLHFMYEILTRMELSLDFAWWLFTQFPTLAFQQLLGTIPSDDPLAGVLSTLGKVITSGPSGVIGDVLDPMKIFALLPGLLNLLFDAIKFITSGAHGQYADPGKALWDGKTAVDKAVDLIKSGVPNATLYLFPGTWANWNQGFPFDVAVRLQNG